MLALTLLNHLTISRAVEGLGLLRPFGSGWTQVALLHFFPPLASAPFSQEDISIPLWFLFFRFCCVPGGSASLPEAVVLTSMSDSPVYS